MSADNWQRCCAVTLDYEGGNDDDPHDPGGRTSRGITQREWNKYRSAHGGMPADVWRAPQAAIIDIYRSQYWSPVEGDTWPKGLDLCVYDAGVNSGLGAALRWARATFSQTSATMQQLALVSSRWNDQVSLVRKYQARRLAFLRGLRTWSYFGRGWGRRVAGIEAIATRWALEGAGVPATAVKGNLTAQAKKAAVASKSAGTGTVVAPTAAGAERSTVEHIDWTSFTVDLLIAVAVLALVVYLIHIWRVQRERAQAFAKVAADVA